METPSVTESKEGAMPKADERAQATSTDEGKTPVKVSKVSSIDTRKYSQKELDAATHAIKSEAGRDRKALEEERDSLKAKLGITEAELGGLNAEIDKLQTKLDNLSADDPEKFEVVKELKAAREERRQVRADKQSLLLEKTGVETGKAELAKWRRDQLVYTVADEFVTATGEAVDNDVFMVKADKFKLNEREGLLALAETMGFKLKVEAEAPKTEEPSVKPYSGNTEGGSGLTEQEKLNRRYPTMKK